jgi:hypothetical protein
MQVALESGDKNSATSVVDSLEHWQRDVDLAGIRDKTSLAELPEPERKACEALWRDVEELLEKANSLRE